MSEPMPPKPEPLLKNPQVVATIIGGVITLVVAIVGVLPVLLNKNAPTPQPVVLLVTATPVPATEAPAVIPNTNTPVPAVATAVPADTSIPPTPLPIATQALQQVEAVTQIPATATTVAPTPAPILPTTAPSVLLLYDEVSFTLANQSGGKLSLEGVTFHSDTGNWDARNWGPSVYNSLPAGMCLRLKKANIGNRQPPAPCTNKIYGLIEVGTTAQFWIGVDSFQVLYNGQVIATCTVSDRSCPIAIG